MLPSGESSARLRIRIRISYYRVIFRYRTLIPSCDMANIVGRRTTFKTSHETFSFYLNITRFFLFVSFSPSLAFYGVSLLLLDPRLIVCSSFVDLGELSGSEPTRHQIRSQDDRCDLQPG